MRKRYSRSYTVLSFLTMFSYRELPSEPPLSYAIKASQREVNIKGENRAAVLPFEGVSPSYP